ncbi:MAG: STAS domain-containing protein, partial [Methylococcales bacterium]|nr:STAS domain-containing protein [Methylococcales bacterium]
MSIETDLVDGNLTIRIIGTFNSNEQKAFRDAYKKTGIRQATLDFQRTEFIDSSGISLLIGLHTSLKKMLIKPVTITNPSA